MRRLPFSSLALVAAGYAASVQQTACGSASNDGSTVSNDGGTADHASGPSDGATAATDAWTADAAGQDAGHAGSDSGAGDASMSDAAPGPLLPPTASCAPTASACAVPAVATAFASYRKDAYLPASAYAEQGAAPTTGGRFQVAAVAGVTGDVTGLLIDGASADALLGQQPKLEWYHVWPAHVTAGQPVWVALHSQDGSWDTAASRSIVVQTSAGDAVNATVPVARSPVPITYVTTTDGGATLVVHVHNGDTAPHTLSRLVVDGADATSAACIPSHTVAPGASAVWTLPLCAPAKPGDAWTVVADWSDGPAAVAVGRALPEHFFVESWVSSSDCAFPGANAAAFAAHQAAGFDTHLLYWGGTPSCGFTGADVVNVRAPAQKDFYVLLADDFLSAPSPQTLITDASRVTGFMVGDEVDGTVYSNGKPNPAAQADLARQLWSMYPGIPVYQGAKTNKNVGAFAGSVDVQGEDLYVAACAPHITQWGTAPPLRAAYDYLSNTRANSMPLPTWLYSQGLSGAWDRKQPVTNATLRIQAEPAEILVQAMSAVAAGAKGLMWFQSSQDEASAVPESWTAMSQLNWAVRGVRALLREGDPTGAATASGPAIVEAIRARDALVVPVISLATSSGPTDVACAQAQVGLGPVPHWTMSAQTVDVGVTVPDDLAIADVFEVSLAKGTTTDPAVAPTVAGRVLTFHALPLDAGTPVRLLVAARTSALRGAVAGAMVAK